MFIAILKYQDWKAMESIDEKREAKASTHKPKDGDLVLVTNQYTIRHSNSKKILVRGNYFDDALMERYYIPGINQSKCIYYLYDTEYDPKPLEANIITGEAENEAMDFAINNIDKIRQIYKKPITQKLIIQVFEVDKTHALQLLETMEGLGLIKKYNSFHQFDKGLRILVDTKMGRKIETKRDQNLITKTHTENPELNKKPQPKEYDARRIEKEVLAEIQSKSDGNYNDTYVKPKKVKTDDDYTPEEEEVARKWMMKNPDHQVTSWPIKDIVKYMRKKKLLDKSIKKPIAIQKEPTNPRTAAKAERKKIKRISRQQTPRD